MSLPLFQRVFYRRTHSYKYFSQINPKCLYKCLRKKNLYFSLFEYKNMQVTEWEREGREREREKESYIHARAHTYVHTQCE